MSIVSRWVLIGVVAACSSRGDGPQPSRDTKSSAAAPVVAPPIDAAPGDDRFDDGALGALTFALSEGTPKARAHFTRGLAALHSFWYDEALRQFRSALVADPTMDMAYWGVGMSYLKLLWGEDDLAKARDIISEMPDPDALSPREQAWIVATLELVRAGDVRTSRQRFLAAMETLHREFPDDESATFLALALLSTTRPEDPDTVAVRKRAAQLAGEVFARNPKHPGAAHYLIHAYDTPELAALALPQAQAYAQIAPAAFHARHMPAHIFSRLGLWAEAITSCEAAWDASVAAARREHLSADHHDFHSLSWLVEMPFERGRRKDADAHLATFAAAVRGGLGRQNRAAYAHQVASYLARTGEWARVDELLAPLEAPAIEEPAAPTLSTARAGAPATHCAPAPASSPLELLEQLAILETRTRAAAMQRDLPGTKRLGGELAALRAKLGPYFASTQPKELLARLDASEARKREALRARAAGDDRALVALLRASAKDVSAEVGGESNPSGFNVHEELGETLLRLDQPKDAIAAFTTALAQHPKRARSLLGLARAHAKAGDAAAARATYAQLAELWAAADADFPGLAEARRGALE